MLLSTDAEKAFDRVAWDYMSQVLQHLGLGRRMLTWIGNIYSTPSARVKVNGLLSDPLAITNGTRQGCPLSPLLFIVSLEPFLCHIRANTNISGIHGDGIPMQKVAAYADDLLFFLSKPVISLPQLMKEFDRFKGLSNFLINYSKSEALNISISAGSIEGVQNSFPFRWSTSSIKYLGTCITRDPSDIFAHNFPSLLTNLKKDMTLWSMGRFSWFGRVNIIKMNIMPRVLYLFQTLPVLIPTWYLRALNRLFSQLIWNGKPPRLKLSILRRSKLQGGLG